MRNVKVWTLRFGISFDHDAQTVYVYAVIPDKFAEDC